MITSILFIILGFALLIKGADFLVEGASGVSKRFHIPEIIIGLTIVSIGTSMPELFVSITSAIDGYSDMAIGNVLGSNLCNLLLILGLSSVIRPIKFKRETRLIEIPLCLLITIVFLLISNINQDISRGEGIALIVMFAMFIIYTIFMAVKGEEFDKKDKEYKQEEIENKNPIIKDILYIIIGIIALKIGGDFTVDHAVNIANIFGISEKIISVTILAVGTSLPELVTSVTAARKGNSDIAIGNILGSNIFNMLLIIGVSSVITPIVYNVSYNMEMYLLIVSTIILALFPIIPPKNEICRSNGVTYLILYFAYLVLLLNIK